MRSLEGVVLILLACSAIGGAEDSTTSLLAKYKAATCLAPRARPGHGVDWNTTLSLRDGTNVIIRGTGFAGGKVVVSYPATGQEYVAAKPYDYVYPVDIRIDPKTNMLYVAANGLAGGIMEQTWLFAFDLRERQQVARRKIRHDDLPAACSGTGAQ